jgi:dipeptidyl aminopeptidase/acylaminoacyl peptidase
MSNARRTAIAALVLTLTGLVPLGSGAGKQRAFTVEDLYRLGQVGQLRVAPDRPLAAFAVKTFDMEANTSLGRLWLADLETGGSRQLTGADKSDFAPRWLPDGRLAFLSVRSGAPQVWAIRVDGGEAVRLTDLATGVDNFAPAPDGKHLAVIAAVFPDCGADMACNKERAAAVDDGKVKARIYSALPVRIWDRWLDERRGHVLWVPLDGGEPRDLTPGSFQTPPLDLGGHMDLDVSPDGTAVVFTANTTRSPAWNTNNDVFEVQVSGGPPRNLTARNEACDAEPKYSPRGDTIAFLAMARPGFEADRRVLTLYDRKTKKLIPLTGSLDATIYDFAWSPRGRSIFFTAPERGRVAIYEATVPAGIVTKRLHLGTHSDVGVTSDGRALVYIKQTMSQPKEIFAASVSGDGERRISAINDAALEGIGMGESSEFAFAGAGGGEVHGFLLRPPGFDAKKKYPLLLLIHGGPQGAFGDEFHQRWNMQLFAAPGFVVAAINFHGSTGYGQEFTDAVSGDWGGQPYDDIMRGVDHLTGGAYPFIDGGNVSAAGASYGGFMINWILGHTDRFRSLVSHDGVYEQVSMYGATEELWFPEWEMKGTPWANPEMYDRFSPARHAAKFRTPTLVVHGEHDYRVPYTQGLQLFTALQRQGIESKLIFFPDENHFVQKPQNARLWWHSVLGWLADHAGLKWAPPSPSPAKPAAKGKPARIAG